MLEALTEAEETKEGQERAAKILEEQRKTLKFALSRPQVSVNLKKKETSLRIIFKLLPFEISSDPAGPVRNAFRVGRGERWHGEESNERHQQDCSFALRQSSGNTPKC